MIKMALTATMTRATITKVAATAPFFCQKPEAFAAADIGVESVVTEEEDRREDVWVSVGAT